MKNALILFLFLISFNSILAQEKKKFNELSEKEFNTMINKSFASVITGQNSSTLGSSASLDPIKTELNFTPMLYSKNGYIFSANFKGGATDGLYSVFNNSKLNSNISLDLQFSFINNKKEKSIIYSVEDLNKYRYDKLTTNNKYKIDSLKILFDAEKDRTALVDGIAALVANGLVIDAEIIRLKQVRVALNNPTLIAANDKELEKKAIEKVENDAKIAEENFKLSSFDPINKANIQDNERIGKIRKLEDGVKPIGFGFSWFTIGYKVKNDDFKLLDKNELDYSKQVIKQSFFSHEVKAQYSILKLKDSRIKYWTFSITGKHKSNIEDLKKEEISENTQIGTTSNVTRETSKKYTVYSGNYINGVNQVNLDADFYYFFKGNTVGLHLFPNGKYVNKLKPIHNFGIGIVLPVKDNKKDKSFINAEIYYNAVNVFNTEDSNYPLIQRNDIGLRFTFPINLLPNN